MTPSDPSRLRARDAGLARARRATAWVAALTVVAAGATAGALARAIPGHSTHASTSSTTGTTTPAGSTTGATGTTSTTGSAGSTGAASIPSVQAPVASSSPS